MKKKSKLGGNQQKNVENAPKFKILDAGVYPFDILFTIGSSEEEVVKYLEKKCNYILDAEERAAINFKGRGGRTVRFKGNTMLLWVRKDSTPVVAHEVFHVVELIMDIINTPLNENTSEPYAYLTEYLWKHILKFVYSQK